MREHLTRTHALAESPTLNEEHSQAALPKDECDSVCPWIYQATSNGYMVHRLLPHVYKWLIFVWEKIVVAGFCLVNEFFKLEYRLYSDIYCFILYRIDFIRIKLWIWRWILVLCKKDTRYHIWLFSKFLMRDEQKKVRIDLYPKQNVSIISLYWMWRKKKKKETFPWLQPRPMALEAGVAKDANKSTSLFARTDNAPRSGPLSSHINQGPEQTSKLKGPCTPTLPGNIILQRADLVKETAFVMKRPTNLVSCSSLSTMPVFLSTAATLWRIPPSLSARFLCGLLTLSGFAVNQFDLWVFRSRVGSFCVYWVK